MLGEIDPFDFILAEALSITLSEVRALPNQEVMEWRSFYKYRSAMQELENKTKQSKT